MHQLTDSSLEITLDNFHILVLKESILKCQCLICILEIKYFCWQYFKKNSEITREFQLILKLPNCILVYWREIVLIPKILCSFLHIMITEAFFVSLDLIHSSFSCLLCLAISRLFMWFSCCCCCCFSFIPSTHTHTHKKKLPFICSAMGQMVSILQFPV